MTSFTQYLKFSWICLLFLAFSVSSSDGRQLSVSQGTFGGSLGRLIASTDAGLTKEMNTLGGLAESCLSTMANKASACESCLNSKYLKQICTGCASLFVFDHALCHTRETVNLYTAGAPWKEKLTVSGVGVVGSNPRFMLYPNVFENGVNIAKNAAKSAANKAKNVVKKIFSGWRKRRSLNDLCYLACPDCRDPGCASAIENKFAELKTRVANYEKLVKDWDSTSEAGRDLLKEIWVNESTHKVAKVVVWRDSAWKTYQPSDIAVDLYNQDAMYDAIALYIMNSY